MRWSRNGYYCHISKTTGWSNLERIYSLLYKYEKKVTSSSAISLFRVGASSFQYSRSPVVCFCYLYSFLLHVFTPPQFRFSYLSVSTYCNVISNFYDCNRGNLILARMRIKVAQLAIVSVTTTSKFRHI